MSSRSSLRKTSLDLGLQLRAIFVKKVGIRLLSEQVFFIIVVFFSFAAFQRVFVEFLSRRWWMAVWQTFRGELDQMTRSLRWMGSHSQDIAIRCGKYWPLIGQKRGTGPDCPLIKTDHVTHKLTERKLSVLCTIFDFSKDAVEMLKLTGNRVRLKMCRYTRGLNFEQQQVHLKIRFIYILYTL